MKLAAVTTFPPSTRPLNSFGFYAIKNLADIDAIDRIYVIGDVLNNRPIKQKICLNKTVVNIHRCWRYNAISGPISAYHNIVQLKPDLIWMNLQYTIFGVRPIPGYLGLLIPSLLKRHGYPIIIVLHNYLSSVDTSKMGLNIPVIPNWVLHLADEYALKSICSVDKIFVMRPDYEKDLNRRFPNSSIKFIEQDLYDVGEYVPVNPNSKEILTIGYFGTYKKLEILLEAFKEVQVIEPKAQLRIAGQSSMHTPNYISIIKNKYASNNNIEFLDYVPEEKIKNLFQRSNIIVITNSTSAGDSGVVRLANTFGRPIIVPNEFKKSYHLNHELLGYNNQKDLALLITALLNNPEWQNDLGFRGYSRALISDQNFFTSHKNAIEEVTSREAKC